jgi:hypothetical protein
MLGIEADSADWRNRDAKRRTITLKLGRIRILDVCIISVIIAILHQEKALS